MTTYTSYTYKVNGFEISFNITVKDESDFQSYINYLKPITDSGTAIGQGREYVW
jgi:hypothetical protein